MAITYIIKGKGFTVRLKADQMIRQGGEYRFIKHGQEFCSFGVADVIITSTKEEEL